ncbi:DNA polymerase III subunit alpha [Conexibacter sp. SYSU D00693]|uniref:DNA polymerase III subunit alpha n=1 Tax=Conexibacter sp. SYSU D00693 TaxID=2812560 RepID=UPI001F11FC34|nr:DNA polymerase III subunit alpha [Conexibacter sp. SYSU D00693]
MSYVELHAHSAFSFLDGASLPEELVAAALERGHRALGLVDHNTVSGSMEFAQSAGALGLKAIHGAEVDVVDPAGGGDATRHLTLLVRDARGWRNLCLLLTRAHAHTRGDLPDGASPEVEAIVRRHGGGFRPGGSRQRGRPPRRVLDPVLTLADLEAHAEGLICLSGCARRGVRDEPMMRRLLRAFGRDGFRVELQRPYLRRDRALNRGLASLAERLGVPCVATGDVHAHTRERAQLQDAFVAIREHTTLDASEPLRRGNHSHVLASPAAMAARFADHPDAVAETGRIAEQISFDLTQDLGYRYPGAEDPTADRQLSEVCAARFDLRYPEGHRLRADAVQRLDEELALIRGLGLSGFFLLHHDLLELAREVAAEVRGPSAARAVLPPGRGRGSSVSSIVCYLTGLSHIDPLANDLFLGRFLNDEITALPDIDLDFPRDVREVLIPRVHERYGRERSALVAAFPTFRARGAIRELGKALGLPPGEIERVARSSEAFSAKTVDQDIAHALGEDRVDDGRWAWLHRLAHEAHGLPRHLSQHSGGMIVATRPLVDCCPVVPAAMEGRQMVMWDKDSCADAGFLKIDLLGLGMLSAVERCVDMVAARRQETIDLSRIPFDDPETFGMIQRAETTGVFQIESRAQMGSLRRTRPETLDDLTIQVAIVRPGPIVGGAVNPYIERRQRMREDPDYVVPFDHPSLEPVLRDTLGTIIFQDQVIETAMAFAGFSPGEAEGLRRAMSRKRSIEALEAYHQRFVERACARFDDVDEALAERVWTMVKGFSGFGFPKAHGAAFGLLAYQSTWLRVHYAPEFLAALLDEQPMGFYPSDALVHEAQRRGIEVLPPDVNASAVGCTVTPEGAVRVGLGYVLGVREDDVRALVAERDASGPFTSPAELASRAGAGRAALEQLAWSGACDGLVGGDRRRALWELGVAAPGRKVLVAGQGTSGMRMREEAGTQLALGLDTGSAPDLPAVAGWEAMVADYATTGLTTGAHPLGLLRDELRSRGMVAAGDLERLPHGTPVRLPGLVVARQRPGTAKGVCFLLVEDETGTVNVVVPPPVYERDRVVVRAEPLVVAVGVLERHASAGGAINVVVRRLERLDASGTIAARPTETEKNFAIVGGARGEGMGSVTALPGAFAGRPAPEVRPFSILDALELDRRRGEAAARAAPAEELAATGTDDFRAVAPPVQSFAGGRKR